MAPGLGAQSPQLPKPEGPVEVSALRSDPAPNPLDDQRPISLNFQNVVDVNYPDRSATTILAGGSGE